MRKAHTLLFFLTVFLLTKCAVPELGKTLGEEKSSYSYIPINPLPIFQKRGLDCDELGKPQFKELLSSLPDQTVRLAIGEFTASGLVSFSPVEIGYAGNSYRVVLDYISVDVVPVPIYVTPAVMSDSIVTFKPNTPYTHNSGYIVTEAGRFNPFSNSNEQLPPSVSPLGGRLFIIPVYVGVGLRLTADVKILNGTVNLTGLDAITTSAETGQLAGSLSIQTLGITGNNVNKILPFPVQINQSTIQNALLSLGAIKAILYDESTIITPRIVGFENTAGGDQDVANGILSLLAGHPAVWYRPCVEKDK